MTTQTKPTWIVLFVVALMLFMTGIGSAASEKVLKMAFVAPPPVWGPIADFYAREVAKRQPGLQIKSLD